MQVNSTSVADRARRRIMRRLMPYLFVLFVIAYLDRGNLSYAALQMKSELSFTDEVLGFGAGIFFWGYFLLEIPGSILVEKWSARRWIARIMISWGVIAILTGFVQTKNQFYLLRFLLGLGEAGFFHGDDFGPVLISEPVAEINNHAGEKTCLAQTEQKAEQVELVLRLHKTREDGNHAPRDHYAGDPA